MVRLREMSDWVQCSVHHPSPFICTHAQDLLPTWQSDLTSVVIILQRCSVSLSRCTTHTEHQKNILRDRFIHLGTAIARYLNSAGYQTELFDPKSGLPLHQSCGLMRLDDVAVAHHILRYPVSNQGQCTYLLHPQWGDAVYPATIISSAPVAITQHSLQHVVIPNWGYKYWHIISRIRVSRDNVQQHQNFWNRTPVPISAQKPGF